MIEEVSFPSADGTLKLYGDLSLPTDDDGPHKKALPAIVIVNGSGSIDRHGNIPKMKVKLNTSNQFAKHMVEDRPEGRSIAVLSYDKRGIGKSIKKGDNNLFYRTGMIDIVMDAVEAVRYVSSHPRIDKSKIVLMGHSEGAIILPLICREVNNNAGLPPIFGCIFYAGFGETLEKAMELQRENILADVQVETGVKGFLLRKLITEEKLIKQNKDMMAKVHQMGNQNTYQCIVA